MFESLRHWIDSIDEDSRLFDDADDEVLHSALASLLYHIIAQQQHHDGREKHQFDRILTEEFSLSQSQTDHLYQAAKSARGNLHDDLAVINSHLRKNPSIRMTFMRKLLQLINIHGAQSGELDVFYETLHEVFPELKDVSRDDEF